MGKRVKNEETSGTNAKLKKKRNLQEELTTQALMAALCVMVYASTRLFAMLSRSCKARAQSPAFSQALMAALCVILPPHGCLPYARGVP